MPTTVLVVSDTHVPQKAKAVPGVVWAAVERAGVDSAEVDDVIMGCATPEGATGSNIARQIALRAGLPIYGLEARRADLEGLFFELTEGTNRNETPGAPSERDAVVGEEGANL